MAESMMARRLRVKALIDFPFRLARLLRFGMGRREEAWVTTVTVAPTMTWAYSTDNMRSCDHLD
jgi:hypothetical protein